MKKKIDPLKVKQQISIEPSEPEIVLFGLIFVIFGPLNIFPNTYPPISEPIQPNKRENNIIFNWMKLERMKKREK
tara:strand:- start:1297 stop:1521 length:225 start_codon:yes stop_codon:yes gene_type:complete